MGGTEQVPSTSNGQGRTAVLALEQDVAGLSDSHLRSSTRARDVRTPYDRKIDQRNGMSGVNGPRLQNR